MSSTHPGSRPDQVFVTTHWSVVLSARDQDSAVSAEALEKLCRTYWYPLYAFVRRYGHSADDAQDLTQAFFAKLIEKRYLLAVDREKGRFRTFLCTALKRFLANEWDRLHREKRGGQATLLSFDTTLAEERYQGEPSLDLLPPDQVYERRWAFTLLDQALDRLRLHYMEAGKGSEFEQLKEFLTQKRGAIPYEAIGRDLGISEAAARVAVHRLRKRFRERFRAEVANTVATPSELDEEMRHLVGVLSRG